MSGDFDRTKVKCSMNSRLDNGFIIFLEYANIDTDTTIVFLGVIVTALWTIIISRPEWNSAGGIVLVFVPRRRRRRRRRRPASRFGLNISVTIGPRLSKSKMWNLCKKSIFFTNFFFRLG